MDKLVLKRRERWIFAVSLLLCYYLRIVFIRSHYLFTYGLSLNLLYLLIKFLTPLNDEIPDIFDEIDVDFEIPKNIDNEFKPFIRRLPEYDLWLEFVKRTTGIFFLTFFDLFDIPVYVPVLVFYFVMIAFLSAKSLYKHMKKYNYNPFYENKIMFKST